MEMIDLTCPHCGGTMQTDAALTAAHCEYCGHTVLFTDSQRHALQERKKNPPKPVPTTETERYRQKLEEEKKNAPQSSGSADDEGLGRFLMRIFGLRWHFRRFLSVLLMIGVAIVVTAIAAALYAPAYLTGYLIAGVAVTAVGAFCVWVSYSVWRTIPLGVGLGVLLGLVIGLLK